MARLCIPVLFLAGAVWAQEDVWMIGYDSQRTAVSPFDFTPPLALMWQFTSEEAVRESQRQPGTRGIEGMMGMPGDPGMPMVGGMPGARRGGLGPAGMPTTRLSIPVASPVVASDRVFFIINANVYCVDRITGTQLWQRSVGGRVYGSPVYANGYLYVAEDSGGVHTLRGDRGGEEWLFRLDKGVRSPLTYHKGVLYMGCEDGRVYALDTNSKELKWVYSTGGKVRSAATVWRETVYVASQDGYLYALGADGKQRWRINLGDKTCYVAPVVRNEKVYVAAGKKLLAFDATLGHKRWEFKTPELITAAPAVTDTAVFCADGEGAVYCLDQATGAPKWRYPREGQIKPVQSGLFVAGGAVVFRAGTGSLLALDVNTGKAIWSYSLPKQPERPKWMSGAGYLGGPGGTFGPQRMPGGRGGRGGLGGYRGPGGPESGYAVVPEMEYVVEPSAALADNRLYILGDDCVLYGLEATAPDAVPPSIEEAVLEIEGEQKIRFAYAVPIDEADQFPLRFAKVVKVPGSPPVYLSVKVTDLGSGIDPATVEMTMDGRKLDVTFDETEGLLWYIHEAKGRGVVALPNGEHNFVIRASDWRGNRGSAQLAFTVDNSMSPPKVASPRMGGPMGPGLEPGMMGPDMPPGMGPGMPMP